MKKIISLVSILLILSGCQKQDNIKTIIKNNNNTLISINYPKTGNKKLDNKIKNDIDKIYEEFKIEYNNFNSSFDKSELNIDYTLEKFGNIYSITIYFYINGLNLDKPNNFIKTYNYDYKVNKFFDLNNIIKKEDTNKFTRILKNNIIKDYKEYIDLNRLDNIVSPDLKSYKYFSLDNDNLIIYFNPGYISDNYNIIKIKKTELDINLGKKNKLNKVIKSINTKQKILDPKDKYIALTFDDGPSIYTKEIVKILKNNNCNATFFVLGNKVEIYNKTLLDSIRNGNEIGNHSYNHKWLTKLNKSELLNQIEKTQEIIKEELGYNPTHLRPTYGSINNRIKNISDLKITLWNVDTMDWKYKNVNKIVKRATRNLKDGNIILMHDTYKTTVEAVKKIIPIIKKQGYNLVTISEMEEINFIRKKTE